MGGGGANLWLSIISNLVFMFLQACFFFQAGSYDTVKGKGITLPHTPSPGMGFDF